MSPEGKCGSGFGSGWNGWGLERLTGRPSATSAPESVANWVDSLAPGHSAYRAWNSEHSAEHSKPPIWNSVLRAEGSQSRVIFSTFEAGCSGERVPDSESGADGSTCRFWNPTLRVWSLGSAVLRGEGPASPANLGRFSLKLTPLGGCSGFSSTPDFSPQSVLFLCGCPGSVFGKSLVVSGEFAIES